MIEKAIKISETAYESVSAIADQGDLSKARVASALVDAGVKQLPTLEAVLEHLKGDPNVGVREVNGKVYYCEQCNYPLDPNEELEQCPNCETQLNWNDESGGLGIIGWGLLGLAALVFVTSQTRTNQV